MNAARQDERIDHGRMISKSGNRFSDKIMRKLNAILRTDAEAEVALHAMGVHG
jgi:hypothetical protein